MRESQLSSAVATVMAIICDSGWQHWLHNNNCVRIAKAHELQEYAKCWVLMRRTIIFIADIKNSPGLFSECLGAQNIKPISLSLHEVEVLCFQVLQFCYIVSMLVTLSTLHLRTNDIQFIYLQYWLLFLAHTYNGNSKNHQAKEGNII